MKVFWEKLTEGFYSTHGVQRAVVKQLRWDVEKRKGISLLYSSALLSYRGTDSTNVHVTFTPLVLREYFKCVWQWFPNMRWYLFKKKV